ncbi:hypothetical protein KIN34_04540 [Cellulomonas sp. DKR-3]|uniref:Immunity protein 8 of polymorphic toxin system n=1 Tax=Cellulomonas fulva TaxID=2835530 RepID=A0ABS5TWT4_9CELL|nr:Imm8 family immunity protein [Cellulomonas fulva]MBT0993552.1 hypothetical protein [Cellulomonas fulva]
MRAELRGAHTLDDGRPVEEYHPADPADDGVRLRLLVGPADAPGEESFDVVVCTPRWIQRVADEHGPQIGRHLLVVSSLDLPAAVEFLAAHVASLEADDWAGLATELARVGYWEFEDYQE